MGKSEFAAGVQVGELNGEIERRKRINTCLVALRGSQALTGLMMSIVLTIDHQWDPTKAAAFTIMGGLTGLGYYLFNDNRLTILKGIREGIQNSFDMGQAKDKKKNVFTLGDDGELEYADDEAYSKFRGAVR